MKKFRRAWAQQKRLGQAEKKANENLSEAGDPRWRRFSMVDKRWVVRLLLLHSLLAVAVLGLSCAEPGNAARPCESAIDCLAEEHCKDGRCTQNCASAVDCMVSEACKDGRCIAASDPSDGGSAEDVNAEPKPGPEPARGDAGPPPEPKEECRVDGDCPSGHRCDSGRCVKRPPSCTDECRQGQARCAGGKRQECSLNSGCWVWGSVVSCEGGAQCERGICRKVCFKHADCPSGSRCASGKCQACQATCQANTTRCSGEQYQQCLLDDGCLQWSSARRCVVGSVCKGGRCTRGCNSDANCPVGTICTGGACVSGCRGASRCPTGTICQQGQCQKGCNVDADCGLNYGCFNKHCVYKCKTNGGFCPGINMRCQNGYCTCQADSNCLDGKKCVEQVCVSAKCQTNQDCRSGYVCDASECKKPDCTSDKNCKSGYACRNKLCRTTCADDNDCEPRSQCKSGACVKGAACSDSGDCKAGYHCLIHAKTCYASCDSDSQCNTALNYVCDTLTRRCVAKACAGHGECKQLLACTGGVCKSRCQADVDCAPKHMCIQGKCTPGCRGSANCDGYLCSTAKSCLTSCSTDRDCASGYHCNDKTCRKNCSTHKDCSGGFACIYGSCLRPCSGSFHCQVGYACNGGACVKKSSSTCSVDADCGGGFRCGANKVCKTTCSLSSDCLQGMSCKGGLCLLKPCDVETCLGYQCARGGRCRKSCSSGADCWKGYGCNSAGTCTPTTCHPSKCRGFQCNSQGKCRTNCKVNEHCWSGTYCKESHGACYLTINCTPSLLCQYGYRTCAGSGPSSRCTGRCSKDSECHGDRVCSQSYCVDDPLGAKLYPHCSTCPAQICLSVNKSGAKYRSRCTKKCSPTLPCPSGYSCGTGNGVSAKYGGCFKTCSKTSDCTALDPGLTCSNGVCLIP